MFVFNKSICNCVKLHSSRLLEVELKRTPWNMTGHSCLCQAWDTNPLFAASLLCAGNWKAILDEVKLTIDQISCARLTFSPSCVLQLDQHVQCFNSLTVHAYEIKCRERQLYLLQQSGCAQGLSYHFFFLWSHSFIFWSCWVGTGSQMYYSQVCQCENWVIASSCCSVCGRWDKGLCDDM